MAPSRCFSIPSECSLHVVLIDVTDLKCQNLVEGDVLAFRHPIFKKAIQSCFFSNPGKSIGFVNPREFCPIPFSVLALLATIVSIACYFGELRTHILFEIDQLPDRWIYERELQAASAECRGSVGLVPNVLQSTHGDGW